MKKTTQTLEQTPKLQLQDTRAKPRMQMQLANDRPNSTTYP